MEENDRFSSCTWGPEGCLDCEVRHPKHSLLKGWLSFISGKQRKCTWPQTVAGETAETTQQASKDKLVRGMGTQGAAVRPTSRSVPAPSSAPLLGRLPQGGSARKAAGMYQHGHLH